MIPQKSIKKEPSLALVLLAYLKHAVRIRKFCGEKFGEGVIPNDHRPLRARIQEHFPGCPIDENKLPGPCAGKTTCRIGLEIKRLPQRTKKFRVFELEIATGALGGKITDGARKILGCLIPDVILGARAEHAPTPFL